MKKALKDESCNSTTKRTIFAENKAELDSEVCMILSDEQNRTYLEYFDNRKKSKVNEK